MTASSASTKPKSWPFDAEIVWRNVFVITLYHFIALQGLYYVLSGTTSWKTNLYSFIILWLTGQGITAGVHRLWSHRSYKAKLPLRIILATLQTLAFQNSIFEWCRDHRVHHKFTDTDADPHNSLRGFFFCHVGWLMMRKHPDVKLIGQKVDLSDLEADPVVAFQKKYYIILAPLVCFVLPPLVPWYFWNEEWYISFATVGMLRYVVSLHFTWSVNSAAHMWGYQPYDITIRPKENKWVTLVSQGEGWHNFHHSFPWDYKTGEFGNYTGNTTKAVIDLMAKLGWAYDMRVVSNDMVLRKIQKNRQVQLAGS